MSDDVKETLDAAKEQIKGAISSRFNSPFLGPFIISWMAWNHRLIFTLFSGGSLEERFRYIDEILYPGRIDFFNFNIAWPLASTAFYIGIVPFITEVVDWWNLGMDRRRKAQVLKSAGLEPMSSEQSKNLRAENAEYRRVDAARAAELVNVRRMLAGWKAMALTNGNLPGARSGIDDLVRSQPFHFLHPDSEPEVQAILSFRQDGSVEWKTVEDAPFSDAETWRLTGTELALRGATGSVIAKFQFDAGTCTFVGEAYAHPNYLQPSGFLVRKPSEYP